MLKQEKHNYRGEGGEGNGYHPLFLGVEKCKIKKLFCKIKTKQPPLKIS